MCERVRCSPIFRTHLKNSSLKPIAFACHMDVVVGNKGTKDEVNRPKGPPSESRGPEGPQTSSVQLIYILESAP